MTKQETPKTLQDAIVHFSNLDNCLDYLVARRWPNGVVCPTCERTDVTYLAKQHKWQCKSAHKQRQFSAKVGTIFEDSPLGLDKWLTTVLLLKECHVITATSRADNAIRPATSDKIVKAILRIREINNCPLKRLGFGFVCHSEERLACPA